MIFIKKRIAKYVNTKRIKKLILKEKDNIYFFRRNIKTKQPSDKLNYKKIGLFRILQKLSKISYKLSLSLIIRIHFVFYISLFESVLANARLNQNIILENYKSEYKIKRIINIR